LSPLIPLGLLLLGTGVLLFGLLPRFPYTGSIAIATVSAALLALLVMALRLPAGATLSPWAPDSLFKVGLMLEVDPLAWLFGVGVLVVALATLLTSLVRPGGRRVIVRGAMLLLTFAGLAALFADNLITRIISWAGLDLIYFLALILLAQSDGIEPQAVLNLAFNSVGTLLAVGAALMISRTSATLSLRDAALTPPSTVLITLAAVFRLGLFPLHLGLPAEANIRQGLGTLLRLIPAAVALEVMARLTVFGIAEPVRLWLTFFGAAAALVGAAQLWNVDDPRLGLTYVVIAQSGLALLAGLWGGAGATAALTAQSFGLLLGGALIFLSNGYDHERPWASLWAALGALALIGAPLTAGFLGASGLYSGLIGARNWPVLAAVIIAQIILAAGLLRAVFWPSQPVDPRASAIAPPVVDETSRERGGEGEPLRRAAYFGGLSLSAVFLILAGVLAGSFSAALRAPDVSLLGWAGRPSLTALGVVLFTAAGGLILWRFESVIRARADVAGAALTPLFRLDWLYRLVWSVIRLLGALIFNLAAVLEGEGAILWTLVGALLVWLLFK
jgi:formate hydrogenlyase subunit 3/multisubunit Na+/H+ antiporter MnhD subunit